MNKIEKYRKLLDSVSDTLVRAYNDNCHVLLRTELFVLEISIKRTVFIWRVCLGLLFFYLCMTVGAFVVLQWYAETSLLKGPSSLIIWLSPLVAMLALAVRKSDKLDKKGTEAEEKLKAFEKVIEVLDPADIRNGSLRSVTVLDEVGIKDNIWILAKKLLFTQELLAFARKSAYFRHNFIYQLNTDGITLSQRLDSCIKHAATVGMLRSREQIVRDMQKASGVDEKSFNRVQNPYLFHSKGSIYCVCAEALCPNGIKLAVYLHTDGVWRSKAITPDPWDPSKSLQTGYFTKEEAEKLLSRMDLVVSV